MLPPFLKDSVLTLTGPPPEVQILDQKTRISIPDLLTQSEDNRLVSPLHCQTRQRQHLCDESACPHITVLFIWDRSKPRRRNTIKKKRKRIAWWESCDSAEQTSVNLCPELANTQTQRPSYCEQTGVCCWFHACLGLRHWLIYRFSSTSWTRKRLLICSESHS